MLERKWKFIIFLKYCWSEQSSRALVKIMDSFWPHHGSAESWSPGNSIFLTSTPDSPYEQAHLENLGLIESKTKTKTLPSNRAVILESFIVRIFHSKEGLFGRALRLFIISGRKHLIEMCVCWCWWPVDWNTTFAEPPLGCQVMGY